MSTEARPAGRTGPCAWCPEFDVGAESQGRLTRNLFVAGGRVTGTREIEYRIHQVLWTGPAELQCCLVGGCRHQANIHSELETR